MASIATVPGSEIDVQTPQQAVHLDAGALNAGTRGRLAMAGAVEDVGNVAQGIADQIQKARNVGIAADADLKMRSAHQSLIASLQNDQDETHWAERADELATSVKDDIFNAEGRKIPPGMRSELDSAFKTWKGSLMVDVQTRAHIQAVNRAWGSVKQDYEDKLQDGDAPGALANITAARSHGLAPAEELDTLERDIPKTIAENFIENGLRNNPRGTLDLLRSGASLPVINSDGKPIVPSAVMSPRQLDAFTNTARIRTDAWQRENFNAMMEEETDQTTGIVPSDTVEQKIIAGEIPERAGRNLIASQDRKAKIDTEEKARVAAAEDRDKYQVLAAKVHDPTAWGVEPELYAKGIIADAAEITNPALRQRAINDANHQLESVRKTGSVAERPVEQQMHELIRNDVETNLNMLPLTVQDVPAVDKREGIHFGGGLLLARPGEAAATRYSKYDQGLKTIREMAPQTAVPAFGPNATREDVLSAVDLHAARIQDEMRQWFNTPEGQKATLEQANEQRMKIERPYVMDAVRAQLASKAPAVVTTQAEFNALPDDAWFNFNGRVGRKQKTTQVATR